jgi:hypothetical protein
VPSPQATQTPVASSAPQSGLFPKASPNITNFDDDDDDDVQFENHIDEKDEKIEKEDED